MVKGSTVHSAPSSLTLCRPCKIHAVQRWQCARHATSHQLSAQPSCRQHLRSVSIRTAALRPRTAEVSPDLIEDIDEEEDLLADSETAVSLRKLAPQSNLVDDEDDDEDDEDEDLLPTTSVARRRQPSAARRASIKEEEDEDEDLLPDYTPAEGAVTDIEATSAPDPPQQGKLCNFTSRHHAASVTSIYLHTSYAQTNTHHHLCAANEFIPPTCSLCYHAASPWHMWLAHTYTRCVQMWAWYPARRGTMQSSCKAVSFCWPRQLTAGLICQMCMYRYTSCAYIALSMHAQQSAVLVSLSSCQESA